MDDNKLGFLSIEWVNRGDDEMRPLLEKLLALKAEKTYEDVLLTLALDRLPRHAHNLDYMAHLLYMVSERPYPVIKMQAIVNIKQGHLYRSFQRAGIEYHSVKSKGVFVDTSFRSWLGAFVDPDAEVLYVGGRRYAFGDPECPFVVDVDVAGESKLVSLCEREDALPRPVPPPMMRLPPRRA